MTKKKDSNSTIVTLICAFIIFSAILISSTIPRLSYLVQQPNVTNNITSEIRIYNGTNITNIVSGHWNRTGNNVFLNDTSNNVQVGGDFLVNGSTLYVDSTFSRVGIRELAPSSPLHIYEDTATVNLSTQEIIV